MLPKRALVIELRKQDSRLTLQQIGVMVGVTRERVRQLLSKAGLQTKACRPRRQRFCEVCNSLCPGRRKVYCSDECWHRAHWVWVECSACKRLKEVRKSYILRHAKRGYEHFFCSKRCLGSRLAANYGFGVFPEHITLGRNHRKHDWDKIWEVHKETGMGAVRLSRILKISQGTLSNILKEMRKKFGISYTRYLKKLVHKKDYGERQCMGCESILPGTKRGNFCSTGCYDRAKSLWFYWNKKERV